MKIAVIGGGNMGAAFVRAFLEKRVVRPADVLIIEQQDLRRKTLAKEFGCKSAPKLDGMLGNYDLLLVAVKPQDFRALSLELKSRLKPKHLVLSIMAGVTLTSMRSLLGGHRKLVRCMPNLPVQIGMGMSVICAGAGVSRREVELVKELFDSAGSCIQVKQESLLDAATAVSGSGPAYVFYIIEHMLKAARELGFSSDEADLLVSQTFLGSLALWSSSESNAQELRSQVTSKGGTTEAALKRFESGHLGKTLIEGVKRACERCSELRAESRSK